MTEPRTKITKRCPLTPSFLETVYDDLNRFKKFVNVRLTPSVNADAAGKDVAARIIAALKKFSDRGSFAGRAVLSGSQRRSVRLKRPDDGDIDVGYHLYSDKHGRKLETFDDFHKARFTASKLIQEFLLEELPNVFDGAEIVSSVVGFVIKAEVRRHRRSVRPWKVDICFAFDLSDDNNNAPRWEQITRHLTDMPISKAVTHTNSFAPYRDQFLATMYERNKALPQLILFFKGWYRIATKDADDAEARVCSFVLEMLAALLVANGIIPAQFDLRRAFATCIQALAEPSRVPSLFFPREMGGGDAPDRPAPPSKQQQVDIRKKAGGADRLVLIDPFLPLNNVAQRKAKEAEAWTVLQTAAKRVVDTLQGKGVASYL